MVQRFGVMGAIISLLMLMLMVSAPATFAVTDSCPDGGVKVESVVDGDLDDIVLDAGTSFCVKAGTEATGLLEADGEMTLADYLKEAGIVGGDGEARNVSHYTVYATPTPTPDATPTPTPTDVDTGGTDDPGMTLPPTDTIDATASTTSGTGFALILFVLFVGSALVLAGVPAKNRR